MKLLLILSLILPISAHAMTKADLKAVVAAADAKGLPDNADVVLNGVGINATYHIQLGKFLETSSGESVELPAQLQLVQ